MSGEALAARVPLQMNAGLVDLNRLVKQATVGRHIVVQLIRMWRDAGHQDYKGAVHGKDFYRRLHALNPVDTVAVSKARQPTFNGTYQKQEETGNENFGINTREELAYYMITMPSVGFER